MPPRLLLSADDVLADPKRWHELRREGLTASEMASVVGLAPPRWGSAFKLYQSKVHGWTGDDEGRTEEQEWGHFAEPWVASRFERQYPDLHLGDGGLYQSVARPWQMATFDRLAYETPVGPFTVAEDALGAVQLKTSGWLDPEEGWGKPGTDEIPPYYRVQVLTEMDVGDYETAWLPVMDSNKRVHVFVIVRNDEAEADIKWLRSMALDFLDKLAKRVPPPVDWTPATYGALKRLHPTLSDREVEIPIGLARRYRRAQAAENEAKRRKGLAVNEIMLRMGDARWAVVKGITGKKGLPVKLATRTKYDQAETITPAHHVDKLQPGRWTP